MHHRETHEHRDCRGGSLRNRSNASSAVVISAGGAHKSGVADALAMVPIQFWTVRNSPDVLAASHALGSTWSFHE